MSALDRSDDFTTTKWTARICERRSRMSRKQEEGGVGEKKEEMKQQSPQKAVDADLELLQSDCQRAYTQAKFTGPTTFARLPKKWWPEHWHGKFKTPA